MKEPSKRQKQITEAALEIISSQGIQNLTIKTLSEKIGITEGAIYRHFTSKAEILAAIADLFKASSTDALNALLATDVTGLQKVKSFFLERCKQFYNSPGLTVVMFSENIFKTTDNMEKKTHETIHSHQQLLMQSIKQAQKEGIVVRNMEPQHLFMIIIGAMRLLVTRWRGSQFSFNLEEEGQKLWDSLEKLITNLS
jgi:TetR/AcrR family transcriptional regulator, fatty acid metabolism regulator protein